MNLVKRIALSTAAMSFAVAPITVASAQAGSWKAKGYNKQAVRCAIIDVRQQRLIDKFDFHNQWQVNRFQQLVNKENAKQCAPQITSYDYLKRFGNFDTLVAALDYAGLNGALNGAGTFTVFAPTDNAFAKLPAGLVASLLTPEGKATLTDILTYHVIAGAAVPSSTAKTLTEATMLNGDKVTISQRNGSLFINDSKVVITDVRTSNGVIHVIDTVLVPSS